MEFVISPSARDFQATRDVGAPMCLGNTVDIISPHPNQDMGSSLSHTKVMDLDEDRVSILESICVSPKTEVISIVALERLVETDPPLATT